MSQRGLSVEGAFVQNPWRLYFDAARMAVEAQQVIALRMARLAEGGPDAALEAQRMVGEKMLAMWASQSAAGWAIASGSGMAGEKALAPARRAGRATRRRLSRRAPR